MSGQSPDSATKPLLGIGSCLAGNAVRYNGDSKSANQHVRALSEHFDTRPFCPEMGIGLGVPRPPIRLVGDVDTVRIVDVASHEHDYTDKIQAFGQQVIDSAPRMCGYILVKGSPSCGYERVKRYADDGRLMGSDQSGVFTAALHAIDPLLPLEDDGRLNDPGLRESFVTRAITYHQWKTLRESGLSAQKLIAFYTRHKYLVMAHHVPSYKALGRMLADAGSQPLEELADTFIATLMNALQQRATRRSHSNALFHISGYLKKRITDAQRQRLATLIEDYRTGKVPLIVPITLLKHHFADTPDAYIDQQVFLDPYHDSLGLRNQL